MNWLRLTFFLFAFCFSLNSASSSPSSDAETEPQPEAFWARHLIRVNSTVQSYQFQHPWAKNAPLTQSGMGVLLPGGNVLVTAELIADHTYVELENPQTSERSPAQVIRVDYDYNLALLHPESLFKDLTPCELDLNAKPGDILSILQLQSNGQLNATEGTLIRAAVTLYPAETSYLLSFRVAAPLQYRDTNATQLVVREQKLTGLIMRTDSQHQTYEVIPAQVIQQFVANPPPYAGVPHLGLTATSTRDPQIRRWLNLPQNGGIYICKVKDHGPAAKAGLQRGDVLFAVDHQPLDEQGNIRDPLFGKINFNYLISTKHRVGDEVSLKVFRNGKFFEGKAKLANEPTEKSLSPAYAPDRQPGYFILGGLVFMELSRPYLQEWGGDWKIRAPQRLVYIDQYQTELPQFHGKVVFLSEVLPSNNTMGFDELSHIILTRVNGHAIHSLTDLAKAASQPINGLQKIEFLEDPHLLYLDAAASSQTDLQLIKDYSIPATTNIEPHASSKSLE